VGSAPQGLIQSTREGSDRLMIKRKPLDLPPEVGRAFMEDMRAFHAEKNAIKRDEIAARASWRLKQHYSGKLRLSDVKRMFEEMRAELD
jgi:hypothetical protein